MTFKSSVIPAGSVVLRSFESEGIHRHSDPIENYYPLVYRGTLAADNKVFFEIDRHLQILSILISSDAIIDAGSHVTLSIKNVKDNITYTFTIMAPVTIPAGTVGVFIDFPFLVISPDWKLEISINFDINYLNIWAKEVFVEPAILGQRNQ